MADQAVVDAVTARLADYLASTSVVRPSPGGVWPLLTPNDEAVPPADGGPFVTLQFPVGSEDMITAGGSVGNRLTREIGTIRLIVSIPRGNGQAVGLQMINALRSEFRFHEMLNAMLRTFGASPAVNNDTNDSDAYYVLSSSIPYWFDFTA